MVGMTFERGLGDALKERWATYVDSGRATQDLSAKFTLDDQILQAKGTSQAV